MSNSRNSHEGANAFVERALAAHSGERIAAPEDFTRDLVNTFTARPHAARRHGLRMAALFIASAIVASTAIAGIAKFSRQNVVSIDASLGPSCSTCRIELHLVASLGKSTDSATHDFLPTIAAARGHFFVSGIGRTTVLVYDSTGKFLRTIGRRGGQGPGEFAQITRVARGVRDSLIVADVLKVSVFSPPPELKFVRSFPIGLGVGIGFAHGIVGFPSGSIVLSTLGTLQERTRPLLLMRAAGVVAPPFGDPPTPVDGCRPCSLKPIAVSGTPGHFWAIIPNKYHLQLLDTLGKERQRIEVIRSSWFATYESAAQQIGAAEYIRPPSEVVGASVEREGRVWTISYAAASDWRGGPLPPRPSAPQATSGRGGGPVSSALIPPDTGMIRRRATIIELLDLASARVVASQRFDGRVLTAISGGMLFSVREASDGEAVADVWEIRLAQGAPTSRR